MMRRFLLAAGAACGLLATVPALAQEEPVPPKQVWSFDGPFGTFDRAAAQRGLQVYMTVCSNCHSLHQLSYRNLSGIGLNEAEIRALAASVTLPGAALDDSGQPKDRPALPSDRFKAPFPNEIAARAANGGALPPDLSLMQKAREYGADHIVGILTGYADPPKGVTVPNGQYFNKYFTGHLISMPPPLANDQVAYTDGTKATVEQMAHDVATFLTWAANPEMEERKRLGVRWVIFLVLLTGATYAVKRRVWRNIH